MYSGYRESPAGMIPIEWEICSLGNLGNWYGGGTPSKANSEYWNNGSIYWVSSQDVKQKYVIATDNLITEKAVSESSSKMTKPGSLIMVMRSGILRHTFPVAITPFPVAVNQDIKVLAPNNDVSTEYIYAYLMFHNKDIVTSLVKTGTTVESVEYDQLKKYSIPLPPLPEQQKIADILTTVDDHISETEALIENTKVLKQGLMQQLLTKGIGHTEFKDTKIGRIPVEWEVVSISDIAKTSSGGTPSRKHPEYYANGNIPWVKTGELTKKYLYSTEEAITEEALKNSSAKIFPNNSLLVAMYGATIGKSTILKISASTNQACCALMCFNDKANFEYLYYYLDFEVNDLISLGAGGAQPNISQQLLCNFQVALPPLPEQRQIVTILTSVDDQIDAYQTKLASLTRLKTGLMQQLLTGKIRVKV